MRLFTEMVFRKLPELLVFALPSRGADAFMSEGSDSLGRAAEAQMDATTKTGLSAALPRQ
jgi:hypothetical protein